MQGKSVRVVLGALAAIAGTLLFGVAPASAAETFVETDSMAQARTISAAVTLDSGKVLVAGGSNGSTAVASVEIFDPAAGANGEWQTVSPMAQARNLHTATLLNDNSNPDDDFVLVVGGASSAELYEVSTDTWYTTPGAPSALRFGHSATLLPNGDVLIAGGLFSNQTSEVYQAATQTFAPVSGTMSDPHSLPSAVLLGNGTVAIGGSHSVNSLEFYDTATGGYAALPGFMSENRSQSAAVPLSGGRALFTGGVNGSFGASATTDLVRSNGGVGPGMGPTMSAARAAHTATALDGGRVLIAGGNENGTALTSAEVYDSSSDSFGAVPQPMSLPRSGHVAAPISGNRVLIAGGAQGESTATATAEIFGFVDEPAEADDDSANVGEDSDFNSIDVLANDQDPDADPFSITSITQPAHGEAGITGGGTGVEYKPDANYCNTEGSDPDDTFTYEVTGGDAATVSVEVTCVDDGPIASDDTADLTEDDPATEIDVLANDADDDGGPKQIATSTDGANGTVVVAVDGSGLTYQPNADFCGGDAFIYELASGGAATVTVDVACVEDDPVAVDDDASVGEDVGAWTIDVLANDTDVDDGPKSIAAKTNGAHGAVEVTSGGAEVTYEPAADFCGADSFTYDLNGGSRATVDVDVTCQDDPPVAVDDDVSVTEDTPKTLDLLANDTDVDAGAKLILSADDGTYGDVEITNGGADVRYSPAEDYCGDDSFHYTLSGGDTATVNVTIDCVNDAPVAEDDSATVNEDSGTTALGVRANDIDVEDDPITVTAVGDPANGTATIAGNGDVEYTPDPGYCNTEGSDPDDVFAYTVNGGDTATVSLSVTCADDDPVAANDSATVQEDSGFTAIDALANDTDDNLGGKTVLGIQSGPAHGTANVTGGGTGVEYRPDADYCNTAGSDPDDTFTYVLNGGSEATVSVAVTCVDDLPTAVDDSASTDEDTAVTIDVRANDTDVDAGPKTVAAKTDGANGDVEITSGNDLRYVPDGDFCGDDSFDYTLNGGSTATVSVEVTCVDDAPVAVNDSASTDEDTAVTIDVRANDTDVDAGPKTVAAKTDGANGNVEITGGGNDLRYIPDGNFCGDDSFTYDLNGGSRATVSVDVACVDDAAAAEDDSETVEEDSGATALDVRGNDTDVEDDPITVTAVGDPDHGTATIAGGDVEYAPDENYCGDDSFTYDVNGGSRATVEVEVTCVDDAPVAVNDSAATDEDTAVTIDARANDTDIDAGPKTVAAKTDGSSGAVEITGGGDLRYAPDENFCGDDSFTYDLNGGSRATVSVDVDCVDDSAQAVDDAATTEEDSSGVTVDVRANDTDVDGGTSTVAAKTNGANGTVEITGGGDDVRYVPARDFCGEDSFTYELNGGSEGAVDVDVTCVDDAPVAVDDSIRTDEDAPVILDVRGNDTDVDGGPKAVAQKTNGAHGAVEASGDGLRYAPEADFCGADSFTYELNGGSRATVAIEVTCVDEPTPPDGGDGPAEPADPGVQPLPNGAPETGKPRIAVDGRTGTLVLSCNRPSPCEGEVKVVAMVPKGDPDAKRKTLAAATYSIPAGETAEVELKLTKVGRRVFAKVDRIAGTAIVASADGSVNEFAVRLVSEKPLK